MNMFEGLQVRDVDQVFLGGQALTQFKEDPAPILPVLEQLKMDSSLYVHKSVANNLNDISKKTHPELVIQIALDWYGKHEYTDWIVKHACRTLLKKKGIGGCCLFFWLQG
ncbi:hypothetical protein GCM10020331_101020 [Ectobacillus funiculus]